MTTFNLEDYVIDQVGTVKVLDNWRMFENESDSIYKGMNPWNEEGAEAFKRFTAERGITFYARPREGFFKFEAYELAEAEGNTYLIMEDLS